MTPVWFDVKDVEKPDHLKNSPLPRVSIYKKPECLYTYFIPAFIIKPKIE